MVDAQPQAASSVERLLHPEDLSESGSEPPSWWGVWDAEMRPGRVTVTFQGWSLGMTGGTSSRGHGSQGHGSWWRRSGC